MFFEVVVAGLEVLPEGVPLLGLVLGQVSFRQAEGEGVDAEEGLAVLQCGGAEGVDLLDVVVRHRVAAYGYAVAVYHERGAGAAVSLVIAVRVADVEGEVEAALWIHLP